MKKLVMFILAGVLFQTSVQAQSFVTDRLPIGDEARKYNFCVAKLNKIFDTKQNREISFRELIANLARNRIVMIGETHTNQSHHDIQFEIIKGLVESGKPVVLALEMYNPGQNEALFQWCSGRTDPNTFLEQTGFLTTWSHNYRYYKAIFDYAREKHIAMYGVNIERNYASKIGRGGLRNLTAEELKNIPAIDSTTTEHRFLIKTMMQGMDATMPKQFGYMYLAQSLWDAAMGEGAIKVARKHPEATVIVLAGSGHVVYNLGIGRILKKRSDFPFVSVVPVDIERKKEKSGVVHAEAKADKKVTKDTLSAKKSDGKQTTRERLKKPFNAHSMGLAMVDTIPSRIVVRSYGDYLWGKPEMKREKYPAFGISLEEDESDGFIIKRVLPGTIAFENGIEKGDKILTIDGRSFKNSTALKKYLQFKNWDEQISFKILRGDEVIELSFIIKPVEEKE